MKRFIAFLFAVLSDSDEHADPEWRKIYWRIRRYKKPRSRASAGEGK